MQTRPAARPVRHREIETLYQRLGPPVAFHLSLSQLAGSVTAGLLLSQSLYWTSHGRDIDLHDGWFHKTQTQWQRETALTRAEQDTARRILRALGVLEESYRGMPRRLWFRVNLMRLGQLLGQPDGCCLSRATVRERDTLPWVRQLLGPIQWFHREFAPLTGSVPSALLLSTVLSYFQRRARREPAVPYLDLLQADWHRATGMKRDQLDLARSALRTRLFIHETRAGLPPRVTMAIDLPRLMAQLAESMARAEAAWQAQRPERTRRAVVELPPRRVPSEPVENGSPMTATAAICPESRAGRLFSGIAQHDVRICASSLQDSCNLSAAFPQISLLDFHTSACRIATNQIAGIPQILYRGLLTTPIRLQPPPPRPPAPADAVINAAAAVLAAAASPPAGTAPDVASSELASPELVFPEFAIAALADSARSLVGHWPAPARLKQAILDELAGAIHVRRLASPIGYLQGLMAAADNQRFVPSLGPTIAASRQRAAAIRAAHAASDSALLAQLSPHDAAASDRPEPSATSAWSRSASSDAHLAALRDLCGIRRPRGDP